MIRSFRGAFAEAILRERRVPKSFPGTLANVARRKLVQLNNASALQDLLTPPGNRLEALRGDLQGKHSIRINDQWRIVFRWTPAGPQDVDIVDYHSRRQKWRDGWARFTPAKCCARSFSNPCGSRPMGRRVRAGCRARASSGSRVRR